MFLNLLLLFTLTCASGFAAANPTNDIHQIDFKNNFAYRPWCLRPGDRNDEVDQWQLSNQGESVVVTNGVFQDSNQLDFRVCDISYGDLIGDDTDEAIVVTVCNTGGTGNFSEGYIYGMQAGKPRLLAVIPGGDRAYGGIAKATVEKGLLRVERHGTSGPAPFPEWIETRNYRLQGSQLKQVGFARRGEAKSITEPCGVDYRAKYSR